MNDSHNLISQIKKAWAVAKKDMRIYYLKGPVVIFGVIIPMFFFLAFLVGRDVSLDILVPGMIGMSVFFTSTAVTPVITVWESRMKVLERFVSTPISFWAIVLGDVIAASVFGLIVSVIPLVISVLLLGGRMLFLTLITGVILATFGFSAMGELISVSSSADMPATVMMQSTILKFPLVFISGIFVPISNMPQMGQVIALFSPLTYLVDLVAYSTTSTSYFPPLVDVAIILLFMVVFFWAAIALYKKNLPKRV